MKFITRELKNKICTLAINRPDQLNALNQKVLMELNEHISWIENNKKCRVAILTGIGNKAFIAGADIKEMYEMNSQSALEFSRLGQALTTRIENLKTPVIAAVNGYALGGGCEFALCCHMRFASMNALFGQPEVGLGLIAGFGGTQRLPRLIGKGKALELLLRGDPINASEAHSIGLVNNIFPQNKLLSEINEIALKISKNSPLAIQNTIKAVNCGIDLKLQEGLDFERLLFSKIFKSSDVKEGLKSFIMKKAPEFIDS